MKNKILTGVLLCTLFSCSPKIVLNKIQEYPSLSQEDTIMIVNEGEKVPVAATLIGQVAILDRSFTIRCRYDQVLKIAKEETRKATKFQEIFSNPAYPILHTTHKRHSTIIV